jgi:hypothetical protein
MIRLLLDRNFSTAQYDLKYEGKGGTVTLSSTDSLEHALERGQNYAKRFKGALLISKFCVSDWYCGVPKDGTEPQVIQEPHKGFAEDALASYRCLEGPFDSEQEATDAKFQLIAIIEDI